MESSKVRRLGSSRPETQRLEAALRQSRERVQKLAPENPQLTELVVWAEDAAEQGNALVAWDCVLRLDRELTTALSSAELQALMITVDAEVKSKFSGWRRRAADDLLTKASAATALEERRAALVEVMKHVHQRSQNTYVKLEQLAYRLLFSCIFITLSVIAIIVMASIGMFDTGGHRVFGTLASGTLAGLLGGSMSCAPGIAHSAHAQEIPAASMGILISFIRPLFGAAAGLVMAFAVCAEIIPSGPATRLYVAMGLAFAAGFSERWFIGLVERIEKKATPPANAGEPTPATAP